MSPSDLFIVFTRWLHTLAAVAWVGGGLFYLLALRPALKDPRIGEAVGRIVGQEFRNVADTAIWVLVVTGAILFLNRVTSQYATGAYGAILGVKVALAVWMFYLVRFRQRRRAAAETVQEKAGSRLLIRRARAVFSATNLILILGVIVLLLSEILRQLFEEEIL